MEKYDDFEIIYHEILKKTKTFGWKVEKKFQAQF